MTIRGRCTWCGEEAELSPALNGDFCCEGCNPLPMPGTIAPLTSAVDDDWHDDDTYSWGIIYLTPDQNRSNLPTSAGRASRKRENRK